MNELKEQLTVADRVCREAYVYINKGSEMEDSARNSCEKKKKILKILLIVFGVIEGLSMAILPDTRTFLPVFIVILVVAYKFGIVRFLENTQNKKVDLAEKEKAKGIEIMKENAESLSIIPEDYWYPLATNYMLEMVNAGRADTIKEALRLFDEQEHRWKVEESQEQMLEAQNMQIKEMKRIRKDIAFNTVCSILSR